MSSTTHAIQRAAEVVMFGALCFAAADIVWARLESRPPAGPGVPAMTSVASAAVAAPPATSSVQSVLATTQPRIAPPVPPTPPFFSTRATPPQPARPAPALEPLPVLAGTLVGNRVYLAVMQSGTGTRVVRTGDRVGSYIVNWIGPYKACVKDPQGKKHVLALGVGAGSSSAARPTTRASHPGRVSYTAPPPPPPPPPQLTPLAAGRGFAVYSR